MIRSPGFGVVASSVVGCPRATTISTPTSEMANPANGRMDGRLPQQYPRSEHHADRDHRVQDGRIGRGRIGQRPIRERVVQRGAHDAEQQQDSPRPDQHRPLLHDLAPAKRRQDRDHDDPAPIRERDRRHGAGDGAAHDHVPGPEQRGPRQEGGRRVAIEVETVASEACPGLPYTGAFLILSNTYLSTVLIQE